MEGWSILLNKVFKRILNYYEHKNDIHGIYKNVNQVTNDLLAGLHAEFKVSSQFGEDGIIQYIINKIPIENKTFVEFGVEDYTESNTRFLLRNNNWSGLVIDGSEENIQYIKQDEIYWRYDLTAVASFITKDNINLIITNAGIQGDVGLLSVDIDGNDYWVWEAINAINPRIVICEYNGIFGCDKSITIPYNELFNRTKEHYSNLYWGASLPALCDLAKKKGYDFIGSNSVGNNAFFVRKDISSPFKKLSAKEGYTLSKIRESRDQEGRLTYLSGKDRLEAIVECEVYDIELSKILKIKEIM